MSLPLRAIPEADRYGYGFLQHGIIDAYEMQPPESAARADAERMKDGPKREAPLKLGIFGGTFNPVHFGHLRIAEEAREAAGLDRVLFIPSGNPPLKASGIVPARQRYAMVEEAIRDNPHFGILDIELGTRQKSYTVRTLEKLRRLYPGDSLSFITGIDAFLDLPNWHRPEEILGLANVLILSRPGWHFSDLAASPYLALRKKIAAELDSGRLLSSTVQPETGRDVMLLNVAPQAISATDIRRRLAEGRSVKYLLPASVECYIISHNLYASKRPEYKAVARGCRS